MSEPKVIKLKEPIQFGSETITELRLRKPKAKDFRPMGEKRTLGEILDLAGRLCGQPKAVIDELSVEDMWEVSKTIEGFMPAGLEAGSEP